MPRQVTEKRDNDARSTHDSYMADSNNKLAGSEPPPAVTYKNPRRTLPENSITLRHHRIAREASKRNASGPGSEASATQSPRRNSSDESNETGAVSDAKQWFDNSNENPNTVLDTISMDVDPPFFQKESDSSNEDGVKYAVPSQSPAYKFVQSRNQGLLRPGVTHSSSADDYRSVIDDLTIENKRLREELKRYKQMGPDSLRREKLFEVKVHGLPRRKKRELENALRDFTTSLDGSSTGASPHRSKKDKILGKGITSASKHASSSSGSQSRPVPADSAYASMSTGPSSSVPSLSGNLNRSKSDRTVERYLQDIPEGLFPKSNTMTEKEKKKLAVRRLEQLFTGKGLGGHTQQPPPGPVPPIMEDVEMTTVDDKIAHVVPNPDTSRQAQIRLRSRRKESHSRDNGSASNSNGDQTDSRDNGNGSGSGNGSGNGIGNGNGGQSTSPNVAPPEQRPTRPRDLDPDRMQVPSENMEYIRHLGLTAPQQQRQFSAEDVSPDAEGWVYMNLLCNLAQLHMLNVTPAFIRAAVMEKSKQFQLSPDGRMIRWRGGAEGTKFISDSSGNNSQRDNSSEDTDGGSNEQGQQRKKQKKLGGGQGLGSGNDVIASEPSQFRPQLSGSSESFHYKPLFVHQQTSYSSDEQPSAGDETGSSFGPPEESNLGINSRWNYSGISGFSQRKRRRDGAIIYYSGAPFCTDLSGDYGAISPEVSNEDESAPPVGLNATTGPRCQRTSSGSSIPFKPLSSLVSHRAMMDLDFAPPEMTPDESDESDDMDVDFSWSDSTQSASSLTSLEASGLAGVYPDDHFVVHVSTRRPKSTVNGALQQPQLAERTSQETSVSRDTADSIAIRLSTMSTGSPAAPLFEMRVAPVCKVEIEYVSGKFKTLPPAPLPPPTYFRGEAESGTDDSESECSSDVVEGRTTGRRFVMRPPAAGEFSGDEELSSADEEDENSEVEADSDRTSPVKIGKMPDNTVELVTGRPRGGILSRKTTGSSAATAGGAPSAYNSSFGDV